MIKTSDALKVEVMKHGFTRLTCDWTVELRQGKKILAVVPTKGTFKFHRSGNRMQILKSYEAHVTETGVIDNFVLRNKKIPDCWLTAGAGRRWDMDVEMTFDKTTVTAGSIIWLDTFTLWF